MKKRHPLSINPSPISPGAVEKLKDLRIQLLRMAPQKSRKLAALAAVFDNPHNPIITLAHAQWAIEFCEAEMDNMLTSFADELIKKEKL